MSQCAAVTLAGVLGAALAACGGSTKAADTPTAPTGGVEASSAGSAAPPTGEPSAPTDDVSKRPKLRALTPAELPWQPLVPEAGDKGAMIASLWGDMNREPNGFFIRLPPGDKGQLHTHTNDYHGVTITTASAAQDGGKLHTLAAGTYYFQPGGTAHLSACPGSAPCISLAHYNTGKRDYAPAKPGKGAAPDPRVVEKPLAEATWLPFDEANPGRGMWAPLWGDIKAGENGAFVKLPAGNPAFWHIHKSDYHGVVLQGTLDHHESGGQPRELPVGSYYWQPRGYKHVDLCKAGGPDCIVYVYFTGPYDAIPQ